MLSSVRVDSPREVWRVSAQEEKAVRDKILSEYADATTALAIWVEKAFQIGKELSGLGNTLRSEEAGNIAVEYYEKLLSKETYQEIVHLRQAIPQAQNEVARLSDRMKQLGLGHMLGTPKT